MADIINVDNDLEEVILVEDKFDSDQNPGRKMHCIFTWTIKHFNSCKLEPGEEICSPIFNADSSDKTRWYLSVFPNGEKEDDEFVSIHLIRLSTEETPSDDTKFYSKVSILVAESEKCLVDEKVFDFKMLQRVQFNIALQKTMMVEDSLRFFPDEKLTITCQMCTFNNGHPNTTRSDASIERKSSHELLRTLSNDLRALYRSGKFSDVTLKMVDGSISAHKIILCARSSVFAEILETTANRDEISIEEFGKSTMDVLLSYIYTGEIDVEPKVLILQLYEAADKFNVVGLMSSIAPNKVFATTEVINEPLSFTWHIKRFTQLDKSSSRMIYSGKFGTDSTGLWSLSLYFNSENDGEEIGIYLNKLWTRSQKKAVFVQFKIHLIDQNEQPRFEVEMAKSYKLCDRFGFPSFLNRNMLLQNQDELLPGDTLAIRCDMKVSDGTCLSKINHSCSSSSSSIYDISDIRCLSDCLRSLYTSKKNHDIIVTVDGSKKTFILHKTILCARSTRFAKFFEEKDCISKPYTIDISGIKREVLEMLFLFLYTGEIKGLTCDIAADLYAAAKHYNISADIKSICSTYITANLKIDNAFKMMELSSKLKNENLKDMVMDFICNHAEQLMMYTSQWSTFVTEHPNYSSEILKSLTDGYRESKKRRHN